MGAADPLGHYYVLAVYASSRGLAFALFEDQLSLLDWGATIKDGTTKNEHCLTFFARLLDRYVPDVIVVQDTTSMSGKKRSGRVQALYRSIGTIAQAENIEVARYGTASVDEAFDAAGVRTKQERALLVAQMIPVLSHRVPPRRKAWQSEHSRMPLFEAAALGLAHYFHEHKRRGQ
jgi:hypothetical protein